jgi:hypothetical protein
MKFLLKTKDSARFDLIRVRHVQRVPRKKHLKKQPALEYENEKFSSMADRTDLISR